MRTRAGKPKGVLIWDFDRVLFDTERFYRAAENIFKGHGVDKKLLWRAVLRVRKSKVPFSVAHILHILRGWKVKISEKKLRKEIHNHLALTNYFTSDADAMFHRLRKQGLINIIVSFGASSYLRKRILVGCGRKFARHFTGIFSTRKPKYLILKKISRKYVAAPILFIDDTKTHLELVQKHIPGIITIHYSNASSRSSLERLEKKILHYAKIAAKKT